MAALPPSSYPEAPHVANFGTTDDVGSSPGITVAYGLIALEKLRAGRRPDERFVTLRVCAQSRAAFYVDERYLCEVNDRVWLRVPMFMANDDMVLVDLPGYDAIWGSRVVIAKERVVLVLSIN